MGPTGRPLGPSAAVIRRTKPVPRGGVLRVVGIGRLEPGAREPQVQVDGIGGGGLEIEAVEDVLLVAVVVHHGELRAIQKAAGVQPVERNEIAPALAAVRRDRSRRSTIPKRAVGCGDVAVRLGDAQAGARGHHDHQAGLAAIFGGRRALDHLHRLHGVHRKLIRENLALLVGDRLAVDRKMSWKRGRQARETARSNRPRRPAKPASPANSATRTGFRAAACRTARDPRPCGWWDRFPPGPRPASDTVTVVVAAPIFSVNFSSSGTDGPHVDILLAV